MKNMLILLALVLFGCGGSAFSAAQENDDAGHAVEAATVGADSDSGIVASQKSDSGSVAVAVGSDSGGAVDSGADPTTTDATPDVLDSSSGSTLCCSTFEGTPNLVAVPCNPSAPTWFCSVNGSDVSCDECPPQSLCAVLGQGEHPYGGLVGSCS